MKHHLACSESVMVSSTTVKALWGQATGGASSAWSDYGIMGVFLARANKQVQPDSRHFLYATKPHAYLLQNQASFRQTRKQESRPPLHTGQLNANLPGCNLGAFQAGFSSRKPISGMQPCFDPSSLSGTPTPTLVSHLFGGQACPGWSM